MRTGSKGVSFAVIAIVAGLAIAGCGGGSSGGGNSTPPANGVVAVYPGSASVPADASAQVQFSAFLASQPTANFSWSISSGSGNGTINASTGLYTPPSSIPSPPTVTVTATDTAATSEIGTATITITAAQGVTVSPAALSIPAGDTQDFTATVSGAPVTPTWQVDGVAGGNATVGTISANGLYAAPLTPPSGGSVTVTAVSGGNTGTATPTVVFSNASLSGSYAFSYSGGDSSGYPIAVAGSFITNPATGAISGIEDYNSNGSTTVALGLPVSGTYQVYPDGSGGALLQNAATINGTEGLQFTLGAGISGGPSHHALLIRFDSSATGSGAIDQQNTAELNSLPSVSGNYVFGLSGSDATGNPIQFAGIFNTDGAGNIPVNYAEQDINDAGNTTFNAPDQSLHGTYSLDTGNPGSGRGYLTLTSTNTVYPSCNCQFAFYMVDSTHLKLVQIGTNNSELLSGDMYAAPNTARGSYAVGNLNGSYAFTLGGASTNGAFAQGGVFTSNGAGGITGGVVDTNDSGTTHLNQSATSSTYAVDANLGRIALPLTYGASTTNFAAYVGSNGLIEMISLQNNFLDSGNGYLQTSTTSPQGAFALNLTGVVNGGSGGEEDVAGQMTVPNSGSPTGTLFINNLSALANGTPLGSASSVGAVGSTGRGTASIASHLATYPVVYYTIDGNTVLLLESDGSRTMTGVLSRQY
ncbi:MAG TPA: hypothetical protein VNK23_12680 [Candidatus Dormibacteraeota bacterium]|nr:hypothetical protein [Candidatus Dormibacteraeota bacterium]